MSPDLPASDAALAFAVSLAATGALALLSFRRANWSGGGYPSCSRGGASGPNRGGGGAGADAEARKADRSRSSA